MLTMTYQEVADATERCLEENPVLERTPGHPCPLCGRHVASGICHRCRTHHGARELHAGNEAFSDPFRTIEAEAGLEIRSDCRHVLPLVISHLTDRGLLDAEASEIGRLHGLADEEVNEALRALRIVGPPGIGARDILTLLSAQAESLVRVEQAPHWLPLLVRDHLPDLSEGHWGGAAAALGLTEDEVMEGLAIVRTRLRPFVGVATHGGDVPVPCADVLIYRRRDGSLVVEAPNAAWFGLAVANLTDGLGAAAEAEQWLAEYVVAARRLIHQLDSRANVLTRVVGFAVAYQNDFLERGPTHHRPLTRTEVAEELGVHPSTVSRAVKGKRLRLPSGEITDLSCLFGKGGAARAVIQGLVTDPDAPGRSDALLRKELSQQGIDIARRTVAKYRREMTMNPTSHPRRAY